MGEVSIPRRGFTSFLRTSDKRGRAAESLLVSIPRRGFTSFLLSYVGGSEPCMARVEFQSPEGDSLHFYGVFTLMYRSMLLTSSFNPPKGIHFISTASFPAPEGAPLPLVPHFGLIFTPFFRHLAPFWHFREPRLPSKSGEALGCFQNLTTKCGISFPFIDYL